ncbi:hypothetical protein B0H34DRAFT_739078 [Crassisporium funariophilum]|nr:hypothetical protein B0H34DRAFT_739078 [Crassisporium funariophilum]
MPCPPSCDTCDEIFPTVARMKWHCRAKAHRANPYVCPPCDMAFFSLTALESHMNSSTHAYAYDSDQYDGRAYDDALDDMGCDSDAEGRHAKCPFCESLFKSVSAVTQHIESGFHKITRHHVTAAVHAMNIVPNISIKCIEGPPSLPDTTSYIATELSFNGKFYKCYICKKKRKFSTLNALNAHLSSAAHDDDEFQCPKCKRKFTLISAFVQHLESPSCGLADTSEVDKYFNDLSGQFTRALKL